MSEVNSLVPEPHKEAFLSEQAANDPAVKAMQVIGSSLEKIRVNFPIMVQKKTNAVTALSKIQIVESDEQDSLANTYLVKTRVTFNDIEAKRKECTAALDQLKKDLMEPEKAISPTVAGSEFVRIKNLRDKWANKKAEKERLRLAALQLEKDKKDEVIRVKEALSIAVVNGLFGSVEKLSETIKNHVASMTLENWESKEKQFSLKPSLKTETYESYFTSVGYNANLMTAEQFQQLVNEAKTAKPYDKALEEYQKVAVGTVDSWKSTLTEKKENLIKLKGLQETNAIQASSFANTMKQNEQKQEEAIGATIKNEQAVQTSVITTAANNDRMVSEFQHQVGQQDLFSSGAVAGGKRTTRKAIVNCPDSQIVKVLSQVLLACYSNPAFEGHIKKDAAGNKMPADENGIPQYNKWIEPILDFFAQKCNVKVEGVTIKEVVSTIQKS